MPEVTRGIASERVATLPESRGRSSVLNQVVDNGRTIGVGCIQPFS